MSRKGFKIDYVRLKELRKERKIKQVDIAKKIGVTVSAYRKYESGQRCPDAGIIRDISDILKVDFKDICPTVYELINAAENMPLVSENGRDILSELGFCKPFIGLIKHIGYNPEVSSFYESDNACVFIPHIKNGKVVIPKEKETYIQGIDFKNNRCGNAFEFELPVEKLLNIQNEVIHYLSYLIEKEKESED